MKNIIIRMDDFGSAKASNKAILEIVNGTKTAKNGSCMAIGKDMEQGAEALKQVPGICVGLYAVLNSEWDEIKWKPAAPKEKIKSLLNKNGEFYQTQQELAASNPDIEEILLEYNHQLDLLTKYGLNVEYIDSHMIPEAFIPGMTEAFRGWIREKGLMDAYHYYNRTQLGQRPKFEDVYEDYVQNVKAWMMEMSQEGQHFYVLHPAISNEETYLFANQWFPNGIVQHEREFEYRLLTDVNFKKWLEENEIRAICFSEAEKLFNL